MSRWALNRFVLGSFGVALSLLVSGCGGGSEEAAPEAGSGEAAKSSTPTVKGLGASAKDRQKDIDSGAGGAGPDQNAMQKAMANQMGGPGGPGGPDAGGQPGGGYVPGYAQGGQGPESGQGGQPTAGASDLANAPSYAGFGGAGNGILLADNAFVEGGEALTNTGAGAGQPGNPAGGAAAEDFTGPDKAVETFLSAIESKDQDRIANAISRYAPRETKNPAYKKVYTAALEKKLTPEDIDGLVQVFHDYKVVNATLSKSSGTIHVTVGREIKSKSENLPSKYDRRIMVVHRDGARGWRVLDFGNRIAD